MEKKITRPVESKWQTRLEKILQLSDKPEAVSQDDWERYQQLAWELAGAECVAQNLRTRLKTAERQFARGIQGRPCRLQDESSERLAAAVPATNLLQ